MRQTHQAWLRSAASLVVLGAALAGTLPAVAGSVSFSVNMTGEYLVVPTATGVELQMQPFNGTMQPFGQCQAALGGGSSAPTLVFTLANGMTITAAAAFLYGSGPADPATVNGTITAGTGIFVTRVEPSRGRSP